MTVPDTEIAWAAGFYDGEGSCNYSHTSHIQLAISQVNRANLERFQQAVGLGNINGPYGGKNPNHRPFWQWRVNGKRAHRVMRLLLPYLGEEKTGQYQRLVRTSHEGQTELALERLDITPVILRETDKINGHLA